MYTYFNSDSKKNRDYYILLLSYLRQIYMFRMLMIRISTHSKYIYTAANKVQRIPPPNNDFKL